MERFFCVDVVKKRQYCNINAGCDVDYYGVLSIAFNGDVVKKRQYCNINAGCDVDYYGVLSIAFNGDVKIKKCSYF